MLRKAFILFLTLFAVTGIQSCDEAESIVGPDIDPEPVVGCEAASIYDWESLSFSTSLDADETYWLAFDVQETAIYTIDIDATGFECSVFYQCNPDNMAIGDSVLNSFTTTGQNEVNMGVVSPGTYYMSMLNTRNRADFNFTININDIVLGCTDDTALNYNSDANVDDDSCQFNDCNTEYYLENYGEMILDCNGNCAPVSWIGDGYCDDGAWGIYDEEGNIVPINLWCEEVNFDEGDCEIIDEGCTPGLIEDCNGICGPVDWLGDGFCDDGSYQYNGNDIFFNCEEFNNDEGDCDVLGRTQQTRQYPNKRILIND